ncbi:hypothetical protein KI387_037127 [Taxus chinensis]|uniref:Tr-type G domain-containing protein n=1 Tax=Taxus chinensis TaxID=29808 RepID=A0AA38KWB3_TAXCH|nr:hypothetical protein KI387_037127 [Taxus chinensis]
MRQCGADVPHERAMDSISLERERGITISSKVTSLPWNGTELNMVDTPGHADFGGEVERVVGMVEGAVLVVDAGEGPLAQTKFVVAKALKCGIRPVLLLNKVDRPSVSEERCGEVESLIFDLFANLGASEEQLEFPVLYASAKEGWASQTFTKQPAADQRNMSALLDAILKHVPPPQGSLEAPFQMLVSMMERDVYLGRILTGRISSGIVRVGDKVHGLRKTDSGSEKIEEGKVVKLMKKKGTSTAMVDCAGSGDIISIAGLANPVHLDTRYQVLRSGRSGTLSAYSTNIAQFEKDIAVCLMYNVEKGHAPGRIGDWETLSLLKGWTHFLSLDWIAPDVAFESEIILTTGSDHWPISLTLLPSSSPKKRPLKADLMWFKEKSLQDKIKEWWDANLEGTKMFIA